jgi:DNA invertase Pin-like site-specific DNA recombinase
MTIYGYARVSTTDQSLETQIERLMAAGCKLVRREKISGKTTTGRTELQVLMDFIDPGDVLMVVKLDRLGRNTRDVLNLVHELDQKGASLRVLEPAVDTDGPMGKMIVTVLGMVAEMELGFIKERQAVGIAKAKIAGVYKGRPPSVDRAKIADLKAQGFGPSQIARKLGIGRASVYRAREDQPG